MQIHSLLKIYSLLIWSRWMMSGNPDWMRILVMLRRIFLQMMNHHWLGELQEKQQVYIATLTMSLDQLLIELSNT